MNDDSALWCVGYNLEIGTTREVKVGYRVSPNTITSMKQNQGREQVRL